MKNNIITMKACRGQIVTICDVPVVFRRRLEYYGGVVMRDFDGLCDMQFKDHIIKVDLLTDIIHISKFDPDDTTILPLTEVGNIYAL